MLKSLLRTFIFTLLSLLVAQFIIGGFVFSGETNLTALIVVIVLALLNFTITPLLGLLSLPVKGPGYIFLGLVLNLVVFFVLSEYLPGFSVGATEMAELNIFGFVLPSKSLSQTWALVLSALVFVLCFGFFRWLCSDKKK